MFYQRLPLNGSSSSDNSLASCNFFNTTPIVMFSIFGQEEKEERITKILRCGFALFDTFVIKIRMGVVMGMILMIVTLMGK